VLTHDGDTEEMAKHIEETEGVEVLSMGNGLELIKDLGDAEVVSKQYGLDNFEGTHGIGHTRMATESDVDIRSAHPYWAFPYNDVSVVHNGQITNYWIMRRTMERKGHRFMSNCDSELLAVYTADNLANGVALEDSLALDRGNRRRFHLSRRHQRPTRHGQGHNGRQTAGALRKRRSDRDGFRRSGNPRDPARRD